MHRIARALPLAVVLVLAACGRASSPEQLVDDRLTAMQEFGTTLAKVTDKTTAERQRCKVTKLVKKMSKLREEFTRLSDEDKQTCAALSQDIAAELQAAQETMRSEMLRIDPNEEVQRVLGPWLAKL
jgi:septal ring factor EnvC (AmiA/AmiB activator)